MSYWPPYWVLSTRKKTPHGKSFVQPFWPFLLPWIFASDKPNSRTPSLPSCDPQTKEDDRNPFPLTPLKLLPNLDPSLVHTYRTSCSGGGGQRFMHPSDRLAGGGEPSSQAFRTGRMLVEMPCFVFEFRYSGGKTPLIAVAMFAIASLTWRQRILRS